MTTDRPRSSRLSGFYEKSLAERAAILAAWADLDAGESAILRTGLGLDQADKMIENVVGRFDLPLGIGANFVVNGRDVLIPMAVEEPSVVAAVSNAAKLARTGGGFWTGSTRPVMIGQVQLLGVNDPTAAMHAIRAAEPELLVVANTSPTIAARGGGPIGLEVRYLAQTPTEPMLIVHLLFDVRDAMGANAVNTAVEALAPRLEALTGGRALLRILSNLADRRRAWAEVAIPATACGAGDARGTTVIEAIAHANAFAVADPYRAATHNKGILNGIDAVAIATGNDWRAIEAGAHAYAAADGQYRSLTEWRVVPGVQALPLQSALRSAQGWRVTENAEPPYLYGRLELPMATGIVGGATRVHPTARVALKILGVTSAQELAEIMAAVGLAQNLAALRALATEGIQRGHMALHARQVAVAAGATGADVEWIAARLVVEDSIRLERAAQLLAEAGSAGTVD
jgi:hydroxymethylglutaryl-CoA reductase